MYPSKLKTHPVGLIGVEQVLSADGASVQVSAGVLLEFREVHAGVAVHAVAGVNAQAFPPPAQVAEGAVVDAAPLLVIVQVADVAVVPRQPLVTMLALSCISHTSLRDWSDD